MERRSDGYAGAAGESADGKAAPGRHVNAGSGDSQADADPPAIRVGRPFGQRPRPPERNRPQDSAAKTAGRRQAGAFQPS